MQARRKRPHVHAYSWISSLTRQRCSRFHLDVHDVYVTPYFEPDADDLAGTLAYSFGAGKAVVSTPYWHAAELLADGRGPCALRRRTGTSETEIAAQAPDGQ